MAVAGAMKTSKVGNQTNSQDPQAVNSRVFVGNLNTFQSSKTDVERMFQRYGRIAGISMHKGYAFVQFTNPLDARNACLGEDGRSVHAQVLDVNMVAEPKPHQTGRKRQNMTKTGNDWDYYYDRWWKAYFWDYLSLAELLCARTDARAICQGYSQRGIATGATGPGPRAPKKPKPGVLPPSYLDFAPNYYASAAFPQGPARLVPALKRPRLMAPPGSRGGPPAAKVANLTTQQQPLAALGAIKTYSNPDILICGNCREMFSELGELVQHKHNYCKLRFTCKCHVETGSCNGMIGVGCNGSTSGGSLLCVVCKDPFHSAWDLMVHVQSAHMINIYQLASTMPNGHEVSEPHSPPAAHGAPATIDPAADEIAHCDDSISNGVILLDNPVISTILDSKMSCRTQIQKTSRSTTPLPNSPGVHSDEENTTVNEITINDAEGKSSDEENITANGAQTDEGKLSDEEITIVQNINGVQTEEGKSSDEESATARVPRSKAQAQREERKLSDEESTSATVPRSNDETQPEGGKPSILSLSTAQACIMHALRIEQPATSAVQVPVSVKLPLVVASITNSQD